MTISEACLNFYTAVFKRAIKNGLKEKEFFECLKKLIASCKESGVSFIDALRMALDIFDENLAYYEAGECTLNEIL